MADEYISRNLVIKRLEEKKSSICPIEPWEYERYRDICDAIDSDIETVKNIHFADVAPIVHAKAIKFYSDPFTGRMFTTCTACDGKISSKDAFCKHCGAKMDL